MIKVDGYSNLYRDEKTGAIINCDDVGYEQYMRSLENRKKQRNEIDEIRKDIDEIKSLLKNLVEGNNKS